MAIHRIALALVFFAILISSTAAHAGGTVTWTSTGGPTGGFVNALASATNAPGTLFAGTNGGVYLTRDAGTHWQSVSNGLPDDRAVTALVTSPDASLVFAGTHDGAFRTRDLGAHWTQADPRLANELVLSLLIDPQTPSLVYIGTTNTVFKSDNSGDTWTEVGQDLRSAQVWTIAATPDSSALFVATDAGIYSSRDRGGHWTRSGAGLPEATRIQALAITDHGFFAGTTQGLFRSKDGKTWTAAGGIVGGNLVRPILADARRPDRIFAITGDGLAKSTDGGATWAMVSNAPANTPIFSMALDDKNGLYIGTANGVSKTQDDGTTWQQLNTGIVSASVYDLHYLPNDPDTLIAATRYGLWVSADRGLTWKQAQGVGEAYVLSLAVDPDNSRVIYAGTWSSSVFVSKDGGATFARITANVANNAPVGSLAAYHLASDRITLVAGTLGFGVYRTNDEGQNWTALSTGLGGTFRVMQMAFVAPATLYAGTNRGLYRIDASGPSTQWTEVSSALPAEEVSAIDIGKPPSNRMVVAFDASGLYRSYDKGAHWSALGKGAFPTRVRFQTVASNQGDPKIIYVGTDRGIYRSEDDGQTWIASNTGLPPGADVQVIAIDPRSPQNIFAGTNGNGVISGIDQLPVITPPWIPYAGGAGLGLLLITAGVVAWRMRLSPRAQERVRIKDWPIWDTAITHALWTFGQANEINLHKLPRRPLARALQYYVEQHPQDGLTLQASPVALKLDSYLPAQKFFGHWKAAWEIGESGEAFASVTSQMVDQLCTLLGFARVDERAYKGLIGYVVRAPSLRLKIPPRFPIVFIPRHDVSEEDIRVLRDLMGVLNMTSYFALIVDLRNAPDKDQRQSLKRLMRQAIHDFIVLDGKDMHDLLAARDHAHRLVEIILDQVDLTVVSPYVTSGPVPENMFFGRDHELKTIIRTVRDTNFAIVGGRKIGKTSVLARVYRLLQEAPEYQPFYLDCQAIHTDSDFFEAIDTLWHTPLPGPTPEGFRRLATDLVAQYPNRSIVMLFDEIDALLQYDIAQNEHLFQILRALSQENQIRYIFCGEKLLSAALHDPNLVFFNFCNVLPLTYLTPAEARRVVVEPMQEMGIALERDGSLADHVVELTAGHPNIIQYICQKLIERINIRRERVITRADVDALSQSAQFAEYFAAISWGNANSLERLITLMMLECPQVTVSELADLLRSHELGVTPPQLESAFDGLCLYSILRRDGPKYAFAANAFPEVLRRSQDVSGLLTSLIQEIKNGNGASG